MTRHSRTHPSSLCVDLSARPKEILIRLVCLVRLLVGHERSVAIVHHELVQVALLRDLLEVLLRQLLHVLLPRCSAAPPV
eukprot:COSAG04_NODE_2966_length_3337_cov_173.410130_3_plen_80_part_00